MTAPLRLALALVAAGLATAAAAAPVPLPPPPAGTALRPGGPDRRLSAGGSVGLAAPLGNGGDAAPTFAAWASLPWRTTPAGVALDGALVLRAFLPQEHAVAGLESGATGLELLPAVRASVGLGRPSLSARVDAGLGLVARWSWVQVDTRYLGRRTETDTDLSAVARLGLALDWAATPRVTVAIEPVSLGFDFEGRADWILAVGASYRL